MSEREDEALQRIHIYMFERDINTIKAIISRQSDMSKFIRTIVRNYLNRMREKAQNKSQEETKDA